MMTTKLTLILFPSPSLYLSLSLSLIIRIKNKIKWKQFVQFALLEALPADVAAAVDADAAAAVGDNEIEISLLIAFNIYNWPKKNCDWLAEITTGETRANNGEQEEEEKEVGERARNRRKQREREPEKLPRIIPQGQSANRVRQKEKGIKRGACGGGGKRAKGANEVGEISDELLSCNGISNCSQVCF